VPSDPDCLFCDLFREGDHVAATEGFVAIRDINPQARTHREIAEFPPGEAKRMLDFIAEVAAAEGLTDYRVVVNVGQGAGQTIFHLHWHILGGGPIGRMA
jgi:histidine triad (HIT) family protein